VGEWKDGELVEARSNDPLALTALAMRTGGTLHLLVANLTPRPQTAEVGPLKSNQARVRQLDEETAPTAMSDPASFRQSFETHEVRNGRLQEELLPYAVIRIDEDES
jgi:hypothetical protein